MSEMGRPLHALDLHIPGTQYPIPNTKYQIPMTTQHCPICGDEVQPSQRYPRYVCHPCGLKAASAGGRRLRFSNVSFSGGYQAHYEDNGEEYPSHECFIDGVRCLADEHRFGGIIIQVAVDPAHL